MKTPLLKQFIGKIKGVDPVDVAVPGSMAAILAATLYATRKQPGAVEVKQASKVDSGKQALGKARDLVLRYVELIRGGNPERLKNYKDLKKFFLGAKARAAASGIFYALGPRKSAPILDMAKTTFRDLESAERNMEKTVRAGKPYYVSVGSDMGGFGKSFSVDGKEVADELKAVSRARLVTAIASGLALGGGLGGYRAVKHRSGKEA